MTPEQITNYWLTVGIVASLLFAAFGFLCGYIKGCHDALDDRNDECPYPVEEIFVEDSPPSGPRHSNAGAIV